MDNSLFVVLTGKWIGLLVAQVAILTNNSDIFTLYVLRTSIGMYRSQKYTDVDKKIEKA